MRFLFCVCCIALVVRSTPGFAQTAKGSEPPIPDIDAGSIQPGSWAAPSRVGRVSLVSGNVALRRSDDTGWSDAEPNQPVFAGALLRTDPRARSEIRIGANTISLSDATETWLANLDERFTQITVQHGRMGFRLRQLADGETVEIDFPRGGVWLLGPGIYDIDVGSGEQPSRVAVLQGTAHVVGGGSDAKIEAGQTAVLADTEAALEIEAAVPDAFVEWYGERDYDVTRLAASYFISPNMTGFAELDSAGVWKIDAKYGSVWFPTDLEWAPYRFGHWASIAPWGWTWIDDRAWAFAPSHYGRWALINELWAWVPGSFVERPRYAPAVVAFLGTPGVGLSSEEGPSVAWFPLAPDEAYWPSYTRDVDYVRLLNFGNVKDVESIGLQANGEPPLELFNEEFANREYATVIPRSVFIKGRPAAPARLTLPEQRLQNAPVLMASPQIAPPSPQTIVRAVNKPANAAPDRVVIRLRRKGKEMRARTATAQPPGRAQAALIRGAHLHTPTNSGQRGRQTTVLRAAYQMRGGVWTSLR
jgi:hypothetical protein